MQFEVPDPIEREIRKLRRECAKLRAQRNLLRDELETYKDAYRRDVLDKK